MIRAIFTVLVAACLITSSCKSDDERKAVLASPEIIDFVRFFFEPGASLGTGHKEGFVVDGTDVPGLTSSDGYDPCNRTREYCLEYVPGYIVSNESGHKTVEGGEPDDFVYLISVLRGKAQQVHSTGPSASILGACWISDLQFAVYGTEEGAGYVILFDIAEGIRTKYPLDKAKARPDADWKAWVLRGHDERSGT